MDFPLVLQVLAFTITLVGLQSVGNIYKKDRRSPMDGEREGDSGRNIGKGVLGSGGSGI